VKRQYKTQFSDELIAEIKEHVMNNSVNSASKKFGLTRPRISNLIGDPKPRKKYTYPSTKVKKPKKPDQNKIRYSEEFKKEVLDYEKDNTIEKTCEVFGVSKYSVNKWKGWIRKNVKISNKKWYAAHRSEYFSIEKNKIRHRENCANFRIKNPNYTKQATKKFSIRHRFFKLAEYSNRNFFRRGFTDYYKLTAYDLWKIAKSQKLICPITGYKLTNENLSVDHIHPISKGGSNDPSNIRLVDKWVNIMLYTKTDEELLKICKDIICHNS
jgi:hypothetical protein